MPFYGVIVPITGTIYVEVEADSEEDAIEKAFISDDLVRSNIEEWEAHRFVVEGNVFHGTQNEAEATLIEEE